MSLAKITKKKIQKASVAFSAPTGKSFRLRVDLDCNLRSPKDPEDHTGLLEAGMHVTTPESGALEIELEGQFIFEFEQIPGDYKEAASSICTPIVRRELFQLIDKLLVDMGYSKLGLADKDPIPPDSAEEPETPEEPG